MTAAIFDFSFIIVLSILLFKAFHTFHLKHAMETPENRFICSGATRCCRQTYIDTSNFYYLTVYTSAVIN